MASTSPLFPTFYGHIASTRDALLLFEGCLGGQLNHVARRPHDRERPSLIKSGNVFVYEEHSSGIKRWTDGVPWSPSRILGNFLVYRELECPFPPGEKKRAMKRGKRSPGITKRELGSNGNGYNDIPDSPPGLDPRNSSSLKETERSLIGSLVDSYGFKEEGLVKKTISVKVGGIDHHLVSYYTVADVMNNKLTTPSKDPRFSYMTPRSDLVTKQNFRTPIDEVDSLPNDRSIYPSYPYTTRNGYEMTNQAITHRPLSLPTLPTAYNPNYSVYSGYNMGPPSGGYDGLGQTMSNSTYGAQFASSPGMYSTPRQENYEMGGYRPRYNSVAGIVSDTRSQGPPSVAFTRRPSNIEQNGLDAGLLGIPSSSSTSRIASDSYASQGYYTAAPSQQGYAAHRAAHRALPTPPQQFGFEKTTSQSYHSVENGRENMWSMGNSSSPQRQYINSQAQ